jgi:hypothetical protein
VGQAGSIPLDSPLGLGFLLTYLYDVVPMVDQAGWWRVHSTEYVYEITHGEQQQLVAYHWHPESGNTSDNTSYPHVHLRGFNPPVDVSRVHWPTGLVAVESIIRLAIDGLQVPARKRNWAAILDRNEQTLRRYSTWDGGSPTRT